MSNGKRCPACYEAECAANKDLHCIALTDNNFGGKKCPFFKTKEQNEKERAYCEQRLEALGRGKQEDELC